MALRCSQCGNDTRFEALRPATLRFAVYPDNRDPSRLYEEKLPLGWEIKGEGEYVCRACGSHNVTSDGAPRA